MMKRFWIIGLLLAVIAGGLMVNSGRQASKLSADVTAADTAGTDTTAPRAAVASFVHDHMGTHARYTLTGTYNRDLAAAQAAASAQSSNSQIYAAAQAACAGKTDSITQAKCNQSYLATHLQAQPAATPAVATPQLSSYAYDLRAPLWTPDLAGALSLGALGAFILSALGYLRPRSKRGRS